MHRLDLAAWLDRKESQLRRVAERLGWPQGWLQEFIGFLGEPRMTFEEFWVRYTLLRLDAQPLLKQTMTEDEARLFYTTHDYMLWRNLVHRRHSAWRRVLWTMHRPQGKMLEFGCGIAPVTSWVKKQRPGWTYNIQDIEGSSHLAYAEWRVQPAGPQPGYDVITALDVFEHLPEPLGDAKRLVSLLNFGGYLHWNFVGNSKRNDLDLASEEQQTETVDYLYKSLVLVWESTGYRVSQKR